VKLPTDGERIGKGLVGGVWNWSTTSPTLDSGVLVLIGGGSKDTYDLDRDKTCAAYSQKRDFPRPGQPFRMQDSGLPLWSVEFGVFLTMDGSIHTTPTTHAVGAP
jgi:hypothetical protein